VTGLMEVPVLYPVDEAAPVLHCSVDYLRAQLRSRRWAGVKIAGRWHMTEEQIVAAIATQSTTAVVPVASPAGLVPRSRFRRRAEVPA
jgi:hypothetical protein